MVRPHEDVDHPGHDPDEGCLMYWALETEDAVGLIADRFLRGERRPAALDAACLDDLGAAVDTGRE